MQVPRGQWPLSKWMNLDLSLGLQTRKPVFVLSLKSTKRNDLSEDSCREPVCPLQKSGCSSGMRCGSPAFFEGTLISRLSHEKTGNEEIILLVLR